MSETTLIDGGESPLAAKATAGAESTPSGQTGPGQSSGGAAPDPSNPGGGAAAAAAYSSNASEPPLGGVMTA